MVFVSKTAKVEVREGRRDQTVKVFNVTIWDLSFLVGKREGLGDLNKGVQSYFRDVALGIKVGVA